MFDLFNLILFNFSKFFSFFHSTGVIKYLEIFYFYQIIYELIKQNKTKLKKLNRFANKMQSSQEGNFSHFRSFHQLLINKLQINIKNVKVLCYFVVKKLNSLCQADISLYA
ncbi:transmembrane protein, putative (macronuclear) [Tetrahymena thermophila SB210]|uniref:Transmembrane protein, putative n=1 Tax=Tetrahymena thermophila (strain SB210) TaxID=312017 RepID=W7XLS3_TETTS|nr:transmembrane protein, putative [Tetrahymena thermophila SB210]EWS76789.1 transmembrane protein, putative [Tetrahymena thermophila SB210]|eukprot:XP_012650676.1 transmembrane protein, putative [Tetrahymena thermophila SB210]